MNQVRSINIPQTCHQSWQQMTPTTRGRHCNSCCKTVVDFTTMTDDKIIQYLSLKTDICGRFEPAQLNIISHKLYTENLAAAAWWKRAILFLGMIGPMAFKAGAQQNMPIVKTADASRKGDGAIPYHRLHGKIDTHHLSVHKKRKLHRLPLLETRSAGVILPSPATELLSSIDLVSVRSLANETVMSAVMGGVIVVRAPLPQRIWYKIRSIFNSSFPPTPPLLKSKYTRIPG